MKFKNPHAYLGIHLQEKSKVIRLWKPLAKSVKLKVLDHYIEVKRKDSFGCFECSVPSQVESLDYKIRCEDGRFYHDPYAFEPSIEKWDTYLFNNGVHYHIEDIMGGRLCEIKRVKGARFAVWAPHAISVAVMGDFNLWNGQEHPMRMLGLSGVWELFIPGLIEGNRYKFAIKTRSGELNLKSDPYSYYAEVRPGNASKLFDVNSYKWNDADWLKKRGGESKPFNIYEVHLGSWKKGLSYIKLAEELVSYCKKMYFSHVELLPISEHPLDESWGYQVTGFYAITSRFGTPRDFQYFIDYLHQNDIGVIVDWVPAHFPMDEWGLARFDGECLYEHEDPRQGVHIDWNTHIFNYGCKEVANFLLGSALFLMRKMHIDGLRVDAVASMLYLDYGKTKGQWIANHAGGNENLEAIKFLKHLNTVLHERFPGVIICAEESSTYPGVTACVENGGLGFDYKWNMGWMNDTVNYFSTDVQLRTKCHHLLTFGLVYAFKEHFQLVFSHDEVVHEKSSLLAKMPGTEEQKFAQVRLFYSYMICQPGKKLLFMGSELGQWSEWDCTGEIEWHLLKYEQHIKLQYTIQSLNRFYHNHPALWEIDRDPSSFEWIDCQDELNSVICYVRKGNQQHLLIIHHFKDYHFPIYKVRCKNIIKAQEIFNTDREEFGGSGRINRKIEIDSNGITIQLAPLATLIFEVTCKSLTI